jgi:hypothetical protein
LSSSSSFALRSKPGGRGEAHIQHPNPNAPLTSPQDVWHPLSFSANGSVIPFTPLASFTLELPD